MTANSFLGLVEEFPGLSIDRFNNGASVFLLSHYHSDHLIGLDTKSFLGSVYCLKITKALLKCDPKYRHVIKFIRDLDHLRQHTISIGGTIEVKLSLIPAYHCEGAVCFLVESPAANVFCTGDVRAEITWVNALARNPFMFPYTTKLRTLDNIYFDSTFEYRGEPYIELPSNFDGIQMVVLILLSYPKDDPEIKFMFADTVLGFEEAWINIINSFDATIHMNEKLCNRVATTGQSKSLMSHEKKYNNKPCFHVGCKCPDMPFTVKIKQCIDFNAVDYIGNFFPIPMTTVSLEKLILQLTTEKGNKIYHINGHQWLLPRGSSQLLPATIKMIFSRHSTYSECCRMIAKLRPRQIYPCSDLKKGWLLGFQMSRLFGKYCSCPQPPSPKDFKYDRDGLNKWGPPLGEVRDRPVKAVNRWDLESCKTEYEIAKRFLMEAGKPQFEFKGQHWVSKFSDPSYGEEDAVSDISRKKDMKLQDLVIGRGERAYRKIIEDLQKVYIYRNIDQGKEFIKDKTRDDEVIQGYNRRVIKLGSADEYNYDQGSYSELFGLNSGAEARSSLGDEGPSENNLREVKSDSEHNSIYDRDTELEETDVDEEDNGIIETSEYVVEEPEEEIKPEGDKVSSTQMSLTCQLRDVERGKKPKRRVNPELRRKKRRIERTVSIESPGESFELSIFILVGRKVSSSSNGS